MRTNPHLTDRSPLLFACSVALGLLAGCAETAPGATDEGSIRSPGVEDLAYEAPLGKTTWIFAHVEAQAACVLHDLDASASDGATMDADAAGWLRVGITPSPTVAVSTLALDCTGVDGSLVKRTVTLRAIPASATPANNPSPPEPERRIIPALEGDPLSPTQRELAARGYPPRPDPALAPAPYAAWLTVVSKPSSMPLVEPVRARSRRGERVFNNTTSDNWSGANTVVTPGDYTSVKASWTVPTVAVDPAMAYTSYHASTWAGLSGQGLIQAGTAQNITVMGNQITARDIHSWYESVKAPGEGGEMKLSPSSYPTSSGDAIYSTTYICEEMWLLLPDGQVVPDGWLASANGTYGCMYVNNLTQSWTSGIRALPIGGPASWVNGRAEWIVERPYVPGNGSYGLTDYGTVLFTGIAASPGPYADAPLCTMINGSGQAMSKPTWQANGDLLLTYVRSE